MNYDIKVKFGQPCVLSCGFFGFAPNPQNESEWTFFTSKSLFNIYLVEKVTERNKIYAGRGKQRDTQTVLFTHYCLLSVCCRRNWPSVKSESESNQCYKRGLVNCVDNTKDTRRGRRVNSKNACVFHCLFPCKWSFILSKHGTSVVGLLSVYIYW